MSAEQPAKDPSWWPAPGETVVRGKLRITNMTGVAQWPATGTHRIVNRCRAGHKETVEVTTNHEYIAAATAGCRTVMPDGRTCQELVNVSQHVGPDGVLIGLVMIPDPKTPPDSREAAR